MQYVNFVQENSGAPTMYTGPVADGDAAYLRQATAYLKPLTDEQYITDPVGILQTMARYSYVLDGDALYWCIEWEPGLLIVKMAAEAELQWVALRSPVPNFAGREPLPEDGDPSENEVDDNPQYNLIFASWDAQFDKEETQMRIKLQYSLRRLMVMWIGIALLVVWIIQPTSQANRLAYAIQSLDSSEPLDSIIPDGKNIQKTAMDATLTKQWSHHKYCVLTVSPITMADLLWGRRRVTLAVTGGPVPNGPPGNPFQPFKWDCPGECHLWTCSFDAEKGTTGPG
jgi:hypothetical protein